MTELPDPASSPRIPSSGAAKRHLPTYEDNGPLGSWRGAVRVTPIDLARGTIYEVLAEWHGPGLPGLPPVDGPVDASDTYTLEDHEAARALAIRAADELRADRVPDLRALYLAQR